MTRSNTEEKLKAKAECGSKSGFSHYGLTLDQTLRFSLLEPGASSNCNVEGNGGSGGKTATLRLFALIFRGTDSV